MTLFGPDLPEGFTYQPSFITQGQEQELASAIAQVAFDTFEMRGVVARRRVKFYGATYGDYPAVPMPDFLQELREHVSAWAGVQPSAFAMALINEYTPGATIGWHRDAPQYDIVAGVSLLSSCRMKLRPYVSPKDAGGAGRAPRKTTHEMTLEPRSAYVMRGLARSGYEHSIPATEALRYSITFRTLR
jgi:alkylated DNA repair dioxygenase AlkB